MQLPQGHKLRTQDNLKVYKCEASIYGLKQSGKVGFRTIHIFLRQLGFQASVNGGGVYYLEMSGNTILLIVYVDDLAYSSNTEELTKWFEKELAAKFQIKCAELIIKFIGLELKQEKDILWLDQEGKILEMAKEYNMHQDEATNIVTPIIVDPVIPTDYNVEIRKLQKIIGELSYIANCSRPDISFAVNFITRNLQTEKLGLLRMSSRILRYLINTRNFAIKLKREEKFSIKALSDASFADCIEDKYKSTVGFIIYMGNVLISWKCKKMKWVAASSGVSEYLALHMLVKEGFKIDVVCPEVYCDSKAARDISKSEAPANATRYLGTKYFMIQQATEEGLINVKEIRTEDNTADLFTKSLDKIKFEKFRNNILCSSI
eukprot:maker-scaffold_34-snap-gene-1.21-mRNA-1 protein AED:0.73 eAED:0.73 QI:0/0/0/0.5/1/1/2/0/375